MSMGKKKDTSAELREEDLDLLSSPHKKHKKHKHKKHKRKREEQDVSLNDAEKPSLKLKIRIGGKTLGEKSIVTKPEILKSVEEEHVDVVVDDISVLVPPQGTTPAVDSDISDEDAWLEALESGRLDDNEMRRIKDPALMTARQRSLLESKTKDGPTAGPSTATPFLMLPMGYKEKVMTEEMIQKRALKAKKRRQQAQEKREIDKKQTIDRLLNKQDIKIKTKRNLRKLEVPKVSYISTRKGIEIVLPSGMEFPLKAQVARLPPISQKCGVPECQNAKKYSCSKTGVPLCSLECYKKNLVIFSRTIPTLFIT